MMRQASENKDCAICSNQVDDRRHERTVNYDGCLIPGGIEVPRSLTIASAGKG